jgi:hypothetical protein
VNLFWLASVDVNANLRLDDIPIYLCDDESLEISAIRYRRVLIFVNAKRVKFHSVKLPCEGRINRKLIQKPPHPKKVEFLLMVSQDFRSPLSLVVEFKVETTKMFKKKKDPTIAVTTDNAVANEIEQKLKTAKKLRRREKCENCKRCWGFCDFLKTSWKIFKEFSADTSIHGEAFGFSK